MASNSTQIPFIPANCAHCGAIWESVLARMFVSRNTRLVGNTETCPVCGELGHVADGTYEYIESAIAILSGPTITYEKLIALQNFLLREQQLSRSIEYAAEEVKSIEPAFSALFRPSGWSKEVKGALIKGASAVLAAFIALYNLPPLQIVVTPENVINQYGKTPVAELLRSNPTRFVPPIPKARPIES